MNYRFKPLDEVEYVGSLHSALRGRKLILQAVVGFKVWKVTDRHGNLYHLVEHNLIPYVKDRTNLILVDFQTKRRLD